jgi:thioredoxin
MHKTISYLFLGVALVLFSCSQRAESKANKNVDEPTTDLKSMGEQSITSGDLKPIYLTTAEFKNKIWDYEANPQEFLYKGTLPCVIDFYADWCKPCKMVAPIMDELADYYNGKVIIYKVNTDKERELASVFQVNSIPAILFAPMNGKPAMQPGALAKEDYMKIIDEFILKIKPENSKNI